MQFNIPQEKISEAKEWMESHHCKFADPMSQGAIGGRFTYQFTPTGIGEICVIQCACGEKKDLTDYDCW